MPNPLFVLILENDIADFELITHELDLFGFTARYERVETEEFVVSARRNRTLFLPIIRWPDSTTCAPWKYCRRRDLVIPFIVLTGAVQKGSLMHEKRRRGLPPQRPHHETGTSGAGALEEAELRRQKLGVEQALR
jgi:hypothetical protein